MLCFSIFVMDEYDYDYDYEEVFLSQPATVPKEQPVEEHFKDTNVQMVFENCIQPSVASVMPNIADLLIYNLLFNVFTQTGVFFNFLWWKFKAKFFFVGLIKKTFSHIVSFFLGTVLLGSMSCPIKFCIFISFLFTSYGVVYTCHRLCKGYSFSSTTFSMAVLILSLLFW